MGPYWVARFSSLSVSIVRHMYC